jgi:hypothetical protein
MNAAMQFAVQGRRSDRMSGAEFRAFQARRPDHERWELVGGVAMMMSRRPCPQSNREQFGTLLNEGLARHTPALLAAQRPGLDLG